MQEKKVDKNISWIHLTRIAEEKTGKKAEEMQDEASENGNWSGKKNNHRKGAKGKRSPSPSCQRRNSTGKGKVKGVLLKNAYIVTNNQNPHTPPHPQKTPKPPQVKKRRAKVIVAIMQRYTEGKRGPGRNELVSR